MAVRNGDFNSRGTFAWVIGVFLLAPQADATTLYHLKVNGNSSVSMRLVFALTSPDSGANALTILNATYDGSGQPTGIVGGPISGALLRASSPADTTVIASGSFYAELVYLLQGYTHFDSDLSISEQGPQSGGILGQVALYYSIREEDQASGMTTDPTGTEALAAIDITGSAGGELSVFSPLSFVAPDTLLFNAQLVDVPRGDGSPRVRFGPIAPNPVRGFTLFSFDFPRGGVARLRIYDVAGRIVAVPLNGVQGLGHHDVAWAATNRSGTKLPSGVYLAELRYGSQTIVRRFVLTR
jgi:hypothetical protein